MRSFKEAVEVRKDETYHRISSTFENLEAPDVVWHGKCPSAQDLIYATTHGRVKTPNHIGLATSVLHMTGSKLLVTMLNRFGHCCPYDDILVVDTSIALDIIACSENLSAVVLSNITPGVFVQVSRDNNDINEETLDGKQTTHATTLVLYQRKQQGPKPKPAVRPAHSEKRRSLNISDANPPPLEFGATCCNLLQRQNRTRVVSVLKLALYYCNSDGFWLVFNTSVYPPVV